MPTAPAARSSPAPEKRAHTRTVDIVVDTLIRATFHRGAEVTIDDAIEGIAATATLLEGRRLPALVDLRGIRSQTAEARAYLSGPHATRVSRAVAIVVDSPVSRVLGNFYLGYNRPEVPTRLFGSLEEAESWLVEQSVTGDDG
jgi:hypothetical protein